MKRIITIITMILICCSVSFAGSKKRDYNPYWMENDKKLRIMEKNCSQYESMQRDFKEKVWKHENEKQLYINKMNEYYNSCKQLKDELMKTIKLKHEMRPYIQTDPYPEWLSLSENQRKEKISEFINWFACLNETEKIEYRTNYLYTIEYENTRLKNELTNCDSFDCRMKYTAYLQSLKTWFEVIDELE